MDPNQGLPSLSPTITSTGPRSEDHHETTSLNGITDEEAILSSSDFSGDAGYDQESKDSDDAISKDHRSPEPPRDVKEVNDQMASLIGLLSEDTRQYLGLNVSPTTESSPSHRHHGAPPPHTVKIDKILQTSSKILTRYMDAVQDSLELSVTRGPGESPREETSVESLHVLYPNLSLRVLRWLVQLRLNNVHKYVRIFNEHEIDWSSLMLLTERELKRMGVTAQGALLKLQLGIRELRVHAGRPVGYFRKPVPMVSTHHGQQQPPMRFSNFSARKRDAGNVPTTPARPHSARDADRKPLRKAELHEELLSPTQQAQLEKAEKEILEVLERRKQNKEREEQRRKEEAQKQSQFKARQEKLLENRLRRLELKNHHPPPPLPVEELLKDKKQKKSKPSSQGAVRANSSRNVDVQPDLTIMESLSENEDESTDKINASAPVDPTSITSSRSNQSMGSKVVSGLEDELVQLETEMSHLVDRLTGLDEAENVGKREKVIAKVESIQQRAHLLTLKVRVEKEKAMKSVGVTAWKQPPSIVVGELLGTGALTETFRGHVSGEEVVLKRVRLPASLLDREYLREQVRLLGSIEHRNLAAFFQALHVGHRLYFVGEFLRAGSLYHLLKRPEPFDHVSFYQIAEDISAGLSHLHGLRPHTIVHSRLNSRNVLLDITLRAKVADFGFLEWRYEASRLERVCGGTAKEGINSVATVSVDHNDYLQWQAPEVVFPSSAGNSGADGAPLTLQPASDVYSLGVVLWEMLTHHSPPYQGLSVYQVMERITKGPPLTIPFSCPSGLRSLIEACWLQTAHLRPTALEVHRRLQSLKLPMSWQILFKEAAIPAWAWESVAHLRCLLQSAVQSSTVGFSLVADSHEEATDSMLSVSGPFGIMFNTLMEVPPDVGLARLALVHLRQKMSLEDSC